jgi:hypothetical protein
VLSEYLICGLVANSHKIEADGNFLVNPVIDVTFAEFSIG